MALFIKLRSDVFEVSEYDLIMNSKYHTVNLPAYRPNRFVSLQETKFPWEVTLFYHLRGFHYVKCSSLASLGLAINDTIEPA